LSSLLRALASGKIGSREMTRKLASLIVLAATALLGAGQKPVLRFAVVADVQYADKPAQGKRAYR